MNSDSVSRDEWLIFSHKPTEFPANDLEEGDSPRPHWLPRRAWLAIDELEVLPAFKGLRKSVGNQSEQWREYFNVSSKSAELWLCYRFLILLWSTKKAAGLSLTFWLNFKFRVAQNCNDHKNFSSVIIYCFLNRIDKLNDSFFFLFFCFSLLVFQILT